MQCYVNQTNIQQVVVIITFEKTVLKTMENMMHRLKSIEEKLHWGEDTFHFFRDGLGAYRERFLKDTPVSQINSPISNLHNKLLHDKELRFPHRKIIEFLLQQYDFKTNNFEEVCFSDLVKGARIGKNMTNDYLALLEYKGYIQKRSDGYRKFFKIRKNN
jgi:hypothetical protein